MSRPAIAWLLSSLSLLAAGCGATAAERARTSNAIVLVTCNVADAALFVDGRFVAPVGLLKGGISLAPGPHRLELRHEAYLGRFFELSLAPAERRRVDGELFPVLP